MSTDFSIRPVGAPAPTPVVQPQTEAAANGVKTQLPPSQAVTAAENNAAVSNDPQSLANATRQTIFDLNAGAMVYEIVSKDTRQVIEQYPDQAVLRRLAYFRELDKERRASASVIPTDVEA
jgi:uncharacterized FlaG/YvyC family protein